MGRCPQQSGPGRTAGKGDHLVSIFPVFNMIAVIIYILWIIWILFIGGCLYAGGFDQQDNNGNKGPDKRIKYRSKRK